MKNRLRSPACVRRSSRSFTRVVDPKPATVFACSRSTTRITPSSARSRRSRGCNTNPLLFPVIERLPAFAVCDFLSLRDIPFDMGADSAPLVAGAIQEIGVIDVRVLDCGNADFCKPFCAGFHDG